MPRYNIQTFLKSKDLASITIENVDKMTLEELAQYLSDKAKTIKVNKGDAEHKQKLGIAKLLPAP